MVAGPRVALQHDSPPWESLTVAQRASEGAVPVGLTVTSPTSRLERLPREPAGRPWSVRVRSLRTQQRAKSQCQLNPVRGGHRRLTRAARLSPTEFLWY